MSLFRGSPLFWLFLPLHLALNLLTLVVFACRGKAWVIWRAKRDAIFGLAKMWHKRRQIQSQRSASLQRILQILKKI